MGMTKRYYTTSKTGEVGEVDLDLVKKLIASGKKKIEDFEVEEVPDDVSKLESFAQGAGQGASFGFGDEGAGIIQAVAKKGKEAVAGGSGQGFLDDYRKARDSYRGTAHEAQDANPKTYLGGELVGGASTAAVPGLQGVNAAKMAALAGLQGLGSSEADLTKGDFEGAGWDTAKGAGVGLVGGKTAQVGMNLLRPSVWGNVARKMGTRALGFTKRFLNSPEKFEKAGKVAQTMLDEKVITPLASPIEMSNRIRSLIKTSGGNIGKYLKSQGTGYETNSAVEAIDALRPMSSSGQPLRGGYYDKINGILDQAVDTLRAHGDIIPFEEANSAKSLLQDLVNWNSTKMESRLGRKIAGATRQSIDDTLEKISKNPLVLGTEEVLGTPGGKEVMAGKVFRTVTPEEAQGKFKGFMKDKKVYGAAQEAQDAMANRLSSEYGNKMIGLTDHIIGDTIAAGEIATGRAPVGAVAAVAGKKWMERYGAQTAASTADWMRKTLEKNPAALRKYAKPLMAASARGIQQLGVAHWVLMEQDPEYRLMVREEAEKEQSE